MTKSLPPLGLTGELYPRPGHSGTRAGYAMLNRHGGYSEEDFTSLNVSDRVGDDVLAVIRNRQRIKDDLGLLSVVSANQTHGTGVHCLKSPVPEDLEVGMAGGCDALITNQRGVGLMIQHADCQAVLFHDPVAEIVAAVHSGWRGSVSNILGRVVDEMVGEFGSEARNIQALISPSLGPCCAEFIHHRDELPEEFLPFMVRDNYFDFWQISLSQLTEKGLLPEQIRASRICTVCSPDYFSYRRACRLSKGVTGRNGSVIFLK